MVTISILARQANRTKITHGLKVDLNSEKEKKAETPNPVQ